MKLECPMCGEFDVKTWEREERFLYGRYVVVADLPIRECESCDFNWEDDETSDARSEAIIKTLLDKVVELEERVRWLEEEDNA